MKHLRLLSLLLFLAVGLFAEAQSTRDKVEATYLSQVGVVELTGQNDGVEVANYLESTGLGEGYAWCAAFVNWTFKQHGVDVPDKAPAWSPSWFPANRTIHKEQARQGDVFGIYFKSKGRIAHVGFIHNWTGGKDYCITVEGNTNEAGSREGDGVYKKRRPKRQIYKVADWISDYTITDTDAIVPGKVEVSKSYPIDLFGYAYVTDCDMDQIRGLSKAKTRVTNPPKVIIENYV